MARSRAWLLAWTLTACADPAVFGEPSPGPVHGSTPFWSMGVGGGAGTPSPGSNGASGAQPEPQACALTSADTGCSRCAKTICCAQVAACAADASCACMSQCRAAKKTDCDEKCGDAGSAWKQLYQCAEYNCVWQCI